ncbi:MAG: CamS family sex pheromone protein [Bacillales bacterium]
MKKLAALVIAFVLLLTGCAPNFSKEEEITQGKDESKKTAIIPKYQISDQYYRTILPFEPSASRGLTLNQLNTRYDVDEFEVGLMRVAQKHFDPEKYLFQEGQYLDKDTILKWLRRESEDSEGLNPADTGKGSAEERNQQNPRYLAQILEHNYLIKDKNGTAKLAGVAIGLALNSVHYYRSEQYGPLQEVKIDDKTLEQEGKRIANVVVGRLRQIEGLEEVPIVIALFKQQSRTSIIPGNFFAYATVGKGSSKLRDWNELKEKYVLFPSDEAKDNHRDDLTSFQNFKDDVEKYFPNFNGVVGTAFYVDDELHKLSINITIQFYGKAETIGFTQYVTGLVMQHFREDYITVEVTISSVGGQEALIVRKAGEKEPFVHIYGV